MLPRALKLGTSIGRLPGEGVSTEVSYLQGFTEGDAFWNLGNI